MGKHSKKSNKSHSSNSQPMMMGMPQMMMMPMMGNQSNESKRKSKRSRSRSAASSSSLSSSEPAATRKQRKLLSRMKNGCLSKSFKTFGGEDRPISDNIKNLMFKEIVTDVDMAVVSHMCRKLRDRLYWTYFKISADTELGRLDLIGAPIMDVIKFLKSKRELVIRDYGEGHMGLLPDLSNLVQVSDSMGYDESRRPVKQVKGSKRGQASCGNVYIYNI